MVHVFLGRRQWELRWWDHSVQPARKFSDEVRELGRLKVRTLIEPILRSVMGSSSSLFVWLPLVKIWGCRLGWLKSSSRFIAIHVQILQVGSKVMGDDIWGCQSVSKFCFRVIWWLRRRCDDRESDLFRH